MTRAARMADAKYSSEDIAQCIDLLQDLIENSAELAHLPQDQRIALIVAAGRLSRPDKHEIRKRKNDSRRLERQKINDHERKLRAETGIRSARGAAVFTAPQKTALVNATFPMLCVQGGIYQGAFLL